MCATEWLCLAYPDTRYAMTIAPPGLRGKLLEDSAVYKLVAGGRGSPKSPTDMIYEPEFFLFLALTNIIIKHFASTSKNLVKKQKKKNMNVHPSLKKKSGVPTKTLVWKILS